METTAICDGACSGNPGPGGWAYALVCGDEIQYKSGGSTHTTNNIMELTAIIEAAQYSPSRIYTDSSYAVNGINKWMHGWARNGWKTTQKQPVKNIDLWQKIYVMWKSNPIELYWVAGHADPTKEFDLKMRRIIEIQLEVDLRARHGYKNH